MFGEEDAIFSRKRSYSARVISDNTVIFKAPINKFLKFLDKY